MRYDNIQYSPYELYSAAHADAVPTANPGVVYVNYHIFLCPKTFYRRKQVQLECTHSREK